MGHNNPDVKETVAIDALAAGGITLKDMHTYPLCTPSRAQLLTGRLPPRTGVTTNFAPESLFGLAAEEHTIASLLKPAGYDTAQLGKWHLGTHPGYHPTWRGFDQSLTVPYSVDMGCLGPAGGPIYNLPAESPCPTGPNNSPKASGASALALYHSTKQCGDPSAASCNAQIVQQPLSEDFLDRNYKKCVAHPKPAQPRAAPGAAPSRAHTHTHTRARTPQSRQAPRRAGSCALARTHTRARTRLPPGANPLPKQVRAVLYHGPRGSGRQPLFHVHGLQPHARAALL